MATTTSNPSSLSTADHSPRYSMDSPQSRRAATRAASSPWTQIVRGESESIATTPSNPPPAAPTMEQAAAAAVDASTFFMAAEEDSSENENGSSNAGKRPVWNKPSNGAVESGPVMGAESWPALSESARVSSKSSSDSLKALSSDGSSSVAVSQGSGPGAVAGAGASSSQKQVSNSGNSNFTTPNHTMPVRQRSMKQRNAGANTSSNGGVTQPPGSPAGPVGEMHSNNPSSTGEHGGQRLLQGRTGNDHSQQQQHRNSFRNRNGGPHSRGGDGSHHHNHNYGGRRDQDRGSQDWNHRNFRDGHMQPQRVVPRFMRHPPPPPPPPTTTPFGAPPPVRPFGAPMGFSELGAPVYYVPAPHPEPLRGVPFVAAPIPPHAMFFTAPDLQLHSKIVNQIDYYFSNENLIKDTFLRQNMDDQGWVPVKLIAGFNKVSHLTDNIQLILDAIRSSTVVEIQGDKIRKRNDWMRWIMPTSVQFPNASGLQSPGKSGPEALAAQARNISLEEKSNSHGNLRTPTDVQTESLLGRSSSGDMYNQPLPCSGEGVNETNIQGGADRFPSARNLSK